MCNCSGKDETARYGKEGKYKGGYVSAWDEDMKIWLIEWIDYSLLVMTVLSSENDSSGFANGVNIDFVQF